MTEQEYQTQERIYMAKQAIAANITALERDLGCVVNYMELCSVPTDTIGSSTPTAHRWISLTVAFPGDLR